MDSDTDLDRLLDAPIGFLSHPDASLRRIAVSACSGGGDEVIAALSGLLLEDPDPAVRAEAAVVLAESGEVALSALRAATGDDEATVVEAVAFALGEIADPDDVPWLMAAATDHTDKLVREAAVAALGAVGDERALALLIHLAAAAPPQVRRRTIVALTGFDHPDAEAAVRAAAQDRNPMVREVADMLLGH